MKKIETTIELDKKLNALVGQGKNKEAVDLLKKETGYECFAVNYDKAFAGKYAPKGYGTDGRPCFLFADATDKEQLIFSYFLANLTYATVYAW